MYSNTITIATWMVVVALTLVQTLAADNTLLRTPSAAALTDSCPCLPRSFCPRIYGTSPEDSKYLGELMQCNDPESVRCCGVSSSSIVGKPISVTSTVATPLTTAEVILLNRFAEIDVTEPPNVSTDITTETIEKHATTTNSNINFISDTTDIDAELHTTTEQQDTTVGDQILTDTTMAPEDDNHTLSPKTPPTKARRPKVVGNVFMIYPSQMSGIPQTSPRNMPESNEMKMIDEETGAKIHLIFATNSTESPVVTHVAEATTFKEETVAAAAVASATTITTIRARKEPLKKRRRYRPSRVRQADMVRTTTIGTTISSKPATQVTSVRAAARYEKPMPSGTTTNDPEKARKKNNRYRLFNSSNRLNFLRKNPPNRMATTQGSGNDYDSSTEVIQNTTTPRHTNVPVTLLPAPNRRFMNRIDNEHKYMIETVRYVLMSAAIPDNQRMSNAPRSFAETKVSNRYAKIERMLVRTLNNTFVEMAKDHKLNRPYRGQKRYQASDVNPSYLASLTTPEPPAIRTPLTSERTNRPFGLRRLRLRPVVDSTTTTPSVEHVQVENKKNSQKFPSRSRVRLHLRTSTQTTSTEQPTTTIVPAAEEVPPAIHQSVTEQSIIETTEFDAAQQRTESPASYATLPLSPNESQQLSQLQSTTEFFAARPLTSSAMELSAKIISEPATPSLSSGSLIAEFRPSPLWTLGDETNGLVSDDIATPLISASSTRQSRALFREPQHFDNGFVPMFAPTLARSYNAQSDLLIVGPIPRPHPVRDDGLIRFGLPAVAGGGQRFR